MAIPHTRIGLFGLFGIGNFGNDGSLEAMLRFLRRVQPDAQLVCLCPEPEDVQAEYATAALAIGWPALSRYRLKLLDRMLLRIPYLVGGWVHALQTARKLDLLVVPGTGMLDDFNARPSGIPYALFRWCLAARLCGKRIWFVSTGAGPIEHWLSRWLMKAAAGMAQYRSYRDQVSRDFMDGIGFDTSDDRIYPDIAFKLPNPPRAHRFDRATDGTTVGLGVMNYGGWRGGGAAAHDIYERYLARITVFLLWLLRQGYRVRILMGDNADRQAAKDVLEKIAAEGFVPAAGQIACETTHSLHDLMREIALTDIVVATRYHNVVCALKLGKPTISLGYAAKNDALLADMGLGEFCQHIESFDVDFLIAQFERLLLQRGGYEKQLDIANLDYQGRLAQQDAILATKLDAYFGRHARDANAGSDVPATEESAAID